MQNCEGGLHRIGAEGRDCRVEFLPFDTGVFGLRCGRLIVGEEGLAGSVLRQTVAAALEDAIKHLVARMHWTCWSTVVAN